MAAAPSDIPDRVKAVIANHLAVDLSKVVDGADIRDDLGADSLDGVELIMLLEEEFGIDIPDDEMDKTFTVADLVKLAQDRVPA